MAENMGAGIPGEAGEAKKKDRNPSAVTRAKWLRSSLSRVNGEAAALREEGWEVTFEVVDGGEVGVKIERTERKVEL